MLSDRYWFAGMVFVALSVGAAYVYGAWVPRHEAWLAPVAAGVVLTAFVRGVWLAKSVRVGRRIGRGLVEGALIGGAMLIPVEVRWAELRMQMDAVPVPRSARNVTREMTGLFAYVGEPDFVVRCVVGQQAKMSSGSMTGSSRGQGVRRWSPLDGRCRTGSSGSMCAGEGRSF